LRYLMLFCCAVVGAVAVVAGQEQDAPKYMGAGKGCLCHKTSRRGKQVQVWQEKDPHSGAYKSLLSEKSKEYAKKHNIEDPTKNPECLRCHATRYGVPDDKVDGLEMEEGVSCEGCHGAGSNYRKLKVMKDKETSVKMGLRPLQTEEDYKKVCGECHNDEVPKEFRKEHRDFKKAWKAYAHPTPKEE